MLSIIIPTLNEEKHLPLLLKSIRHQNLKPKDYEIIVADANSTDRTKEIAKKAGCKIITGGLPAKGRNEGAKIAKGDLLLFLDADMLLPPGFLEDTLKEFKKKKLDMAAFPVLLMGDKVDKFFSKFYNSWTNITKDFLPHAFGGTILVRKKTHDAIRGFDENITLAEDHHYARKIKKIAKYGYLKTDPVSTSSRRFKKDGRLKTAIKYLLAELYMVSLGPIKSEKFKYKFDHYDKEPAPKSGQEKNNQ